MDFFRKSTIPAETPDSAAHFYLRDKLGNKPWGDKSPTAQREFWNATAQWGPTWGTPTERGLGVKSVKMWSQGACGSKPAA